MIVKAYHLQQTEMQLEHAYALAKLQPRECEIVPYAVFRRRLERRERIRKIQEMGRNYDD